MEFSLTEREIAGTFQRSPGEGGLTHTRPPLDTLNPRQGRVFTTGFGRFRVSYRCCNKHANRWAPTRDSPGLPYGSRWAKHRLATGPFRQDGLANLRRPLHQPEDMCHLFHRFRHRCRVSRKFRLPRSKSHPVSSHDDLGAHFGRFVVGVVIFW